MRVNPRAVQKYSKSLLLVLIGFEVILALTYLAGVVFTGKAYPLFDMNGQMTIPSYLQSLQLFLIGLISLIILIFGRHSPYPPSPIFCFTVALLFTYASLDEIFKIHLHLHDLLHTPNSAKDWRPIYLAIGISTLVLFHRDFIAIWHFHRKAITFVALGMGIFFVGGFGVEALKYHLLQVILTQTLYPSHFKIILVETLRVAIEEFSELLGESITLYGLCLFLVKRLGGEKAGGVIIERS